jgi:tripartite-type tricarboxylate transporter receptor subunit TctC
MKWTRRTLAITILLAGIAPGSADNYPSKPIRLLVPVPAGAINDLVARIVGEAITAHTGQPVIIDNRSGSAGNIAMGATARATPDGYTLLLASGGHITTNRLLYKNVGFDPMKDLLPIAPVADIKLIFAVNKKVPATTMQEFLALAKAQPGKINYTSAGPGSTTHFAGDWLTRLAGVDLVHVPHRGAAPAVIDVVAGNVEAITLGVNTLAPHIASGDLRPLVTASAKRLSYLPDVPSAAEAGVPGWEVETWFGLFGPLGLARETVEKLNGYIQDLADNPANKQRMSASYMEAWKMSPEEFSTFAKADASKWERIVKESGFQAQ